ncbi:acetyltransferase (GNAT) family protein [Kribbella sp. VKM Ac-2569]|uniref:GNAT family N-acetyltransferase n=1 Tax=Kribbella sp. VKM Ac-2569 TaxID=2512220 RepID=UPI00102BECB2|nr:GNAT family N-acetyltransferase [Kribbella sp. VKM Ac-2569]RZT15027.1 acetyltransferase (GNAT) family protein [Kribbella sp. VKM Ac-2569]
MHLVTPDAELLVRAVRTFLNTDADPDYLTAPGTLTFVATTEDKVTGWCWGYLLPRPDGVSMLYLHNLAVVEAYRNQGIGRALTSAFMDAGRSAGATKMFLTTGAENAPARKLYDSLGGGLATQGATVNYWFLL